MYRYLTLFSLLLLFACSNNAYNSGTATAPSGTTATAPKAVVKNIDQAAMKIAMKKPGVFVLDVRTPREVAAGKIRGAMEVDFKAAGFQEKLEKLPREKNYIIYCQSGGRSSKAAEVMVGMGFQNVSNLIGGYSQWKEE